MSSEYPNNKRELLKEKCLRYLGGKKCNECGVSHLPIKAYDFHHYKGPKEYNISEMINRNMPWKLIKKELDKCVVLCANCHRVKSTRH